MEVFGSSGTRGVANEDLTPEFATRVAMAVGTVWGADRVALARDTRLTGHMLADAAAAGLASVGVAIDRLGMIPTPALQAYAAAESVPGVMITASHNPPPYNGIKLIGDDGIELTVASLEAVEETLQAGAFDRVSWDAVGTPRDVEGTARRYREGVLGSADRERIEEADLRVAIDPGHGAGCETSPAIFRDLGCEVVTVNATPDGRFPGRDPEPVPGNLEELGRLVRTADADLGIAHDGDADRAIFFDETGSYIEGDAALAALAADALGPDDVTVSGVNVSQRLVDVADAAGAAVELTPIGSTRIITRIRELQAAGRSVPVAGEGNGGIIFPDYRLARDGAFTAVRFLELVATEPASAVVAPYDGYENVRENIAYGSDAERTAILDAIATFAEESEADVTRQDGYRLDYGDGWVLARPSGTEPLVRVYAEARDADRAEELATAMVERIREAKTTAVD